MANADFYEELDLRYPEIAVCIEKIDRTNPGKKKFYIPVLTPNLDTTSLKTKVETVHQNSSNIVNENGPNIENVKIQNYIEIYLPKELCAFVGGDFKVVNKGDMTVKSNGRITIGGSTGLGGGMGPHTHSTLSGGGSYTIDGAETTYKGILNSIPTDQYRYIEKGSKWIVVFIGGDISKPQIIGRYYDPQ